MAIVTRSGSELPCVKLKYFSGYGTSTSVSNVMTLKSAWSSVQVQLCSLALSGSLFNVVRLPRDAFRFGPIPYLLAFTISSIVVGLPVVLLELAVGQLTEQDAVGVWRAVPILRGVGYIKIFTSCLCCVYYMVPLALAAAYFIWIGKGPFPLKECVKLQVTLTGYENSMNASECFNTTFLSPFSTYPHYLAVLAILIFMLWFFIPLTLYRLHKSMKSALALLAPVIFSLALVLAIMVGDPRSLTAMLPTPEQWRELLQPYFWHGALVQSLISVQVKSGYLISTGGTVYRKSDVRWTALTIVLESIIASWVWVLLWEGIGGNDTKDPTFVGILVLIYQSAVEERRAKQWPMIAYAFVFVSGVTTMITLMYPIFDRLQRVAGDRWRLMSVVGFALGTTLTMAMFTQVHNALYILDELALPFLVVFSTILELIAFAFIYGWDSLLNDIEFLLNGKLRCFWIVGWWFTPFILLGVTGWWLRAVLRMAWYQPELSLWPLFGIFLAALAIIVIFAAMAVAKEEQYNLLSKISATFRASRLWGPEDPLARYHWMSQRKPHEAQKNELDTYFSEVYPQATTTKADEKLWMEENFSFQKPYFNNLAFECGESKPTQNGRQKVNWISNNYILNQPTKEFLTNNDDIKPRVQIPDENSKVDNNCKCKRHFPIRVPHYVNGELTTTL